MDEMNKQINTLRKLEIEGNSSSIPKTIDENNNKTNSMANIILNHKISNIFPQN